MHRYWLVFFAMTLIPVWTLTVIETLQTNLVFDGSQEKLLLQNFTETCFQLWRLEAADTGKFSIINKGSGKYLAVRWRRGHGDEVITQPWHGGLTQQWFINSDHVVKSAAGEVVLDIANHNYSPGAEIKVFRRHGGHNQKFYLKQYKGTCGAGRWAPVANE